MAGDKITDYIEAAAAKYLSSVDAESKKSNQHEIGGLNKAGFGKHLGTGSEDFRYKVRQVYIRDEDDDAIVCDSYVTWYDTRRDDETRSSEYRLYYYDSPVTEMMSAGDFLLIAKLKNDIPTLTESLGAKGFEVRPESFLMVFAPAGSSAEAQLRALFGLSNVDGIFRLGKIETVNLILPLRSMLESIGVEVGAGISQADSWLEKLIDKFGGTAFPKTSAFSNFARSSIGDDFSSVDAPDATLMAWMEREESFFRLYERHLVKERLSTGFEADVDAFIDFSLSVQNRRKSRAGHAFEAHLNQLFVDNKLTFEQGKGKGKVTENNSKPDFIFPSFSAYHDPNYPSKNLMMLGAKTTCKDRWRQVLSEANKIPSKHLVTMESAISELQLEEMRYHDLTLVVPALIQTTYSVSQKASLMDVGGFIKTVRELQG